MGEIFPGTLSWTPHKQMLPCSQYMFENVPIVETKSGKAPLGDVAGQTDWNPSRPSPIIWLKVLPDLICAQEKQGKLPSRALPYKTHRELAKPQQGIVSVTWRCPEASGLKRFPKAKPILLSKRVLFLFGLPAFLVFKGIKGIFYASFFSLDTSCKKSKGPR